MIAEAEVEAKLAEQFAAALETEGLPEPRTELSWGVADPGEVKGSGDTSEAVLALAVGIRSYPDFVSPQCDLPCSLALSIRRDACPTGAELAGYIEPLLNLVHTWNADCDTMCDALTTTTFSPAGFQLGGGHLEPTEEARTLSLDFTRRGVIDIAATPEGGDS